MSLQSFFAERVFQIFDRDNSGTVSLSEFLDAMHQFAGKSPNDKIKFLFRVYDLDGEREKERERDANHFHNRSVSVVRYFFLSTELSFVIHNFF